LSVDDRDADGSGQVLGTCRLVLVGRTVQLSRLAVRASARRQGIATALLEAADAETSAAGARRLVLHAQTYARPLYERAGYAPRGSSFREAGIEHIAMDKELS
jgi:predicted GNAT family N-acyltransferase